MTQKNGQLQNVVKELQTRVAELELQVAELRRQQPQPEKDWRRTIGMFAGDEGMKAVFEEGQRIREADRAKAKRSAKRKRQRATR